MFNGAEESVQISVKTVYNNLDPEIITFAEMRRWV